VSGEQLTVKVADFGVADARLAVWPVGRDSERKEHALKPYSGGLTSEALPMPGGKSVFVEVIGGSAEVFKLTTPQKVTGFVDFLEKLVEQIDELAIGKGLAGQLPATQAGTTEALGKWAPGVLEKASAELKPAVAMGSSFFEALGTIDAGRRFAFLERLRQVELLAEMMRRAGLDPKTAELDPFTGVVDYPIKASYSKWVDLPGKPVGTDPVKLLEIALLSSFKLEGLKPANTRLLIMTIPSFFYGSGTYLKITLNKNRTWLLWGPADIEAGKKSKGGNIDLEIGPALLVDGENQIDLETQPAAGVVKAPGEIVVTKPLARATDTTGKDVPVKVTGSN
jgi:hypothetical protein